MFRFSNFNRIFDTLSAGPKKCCEFLQHLINHNAMRATVLSVLVGLTISYQSLCQSVVELDKQNGFREFTIGSPLSSIKKELQFNKVLNRTESKLFQVKENIIVNDLAGQTELIFYRDRLVE